jgi:tetratricopeptide (TPR) repeat protein
MGQFSRANQELRKAIELSIEYNAIFEHCVFDCYRAWFYLLQGKPSDAYSAVTEARELLGSIAEVDEIRETEIEWLLSESLLNISAGESDNRILDEVDPHLNSAFTRCRRSSLVFYEPGIMFTMARSYLARGNAIQAIEKAKEALSLADRCQYRLYQAEIHNFLSHMAQKNGDFEDAEGHAKLAYERAFCNGPKHCYKPALDEAEALLKTLGVKPPKLK